MPRQEQKMDKTITIETELGPVIVRKLALGDYAQLLRAFKKLPAELGKFVQGNSAADLKDLNFILTSVPELIAEALPEFADVVSIATDKDSEFVLKLDLADAIDLLATVLELNNYSRVIESIKKLTARKTTAMEAEPTPTEPAKQPKV